MRIKKRHCRNPYLVGIMGAFSGLIVGFAGSTPLLYAVKAVDVDWGDANIGWGRTYYDGQWDLWSSSWAYSRYDNLVGGMARGGAAVAGSFVSGFVADAIGRLRTVQLAAVVWVIAGVLMATTGPSIKPGRFAQSIAGEVFTGIGLGMTSSQTPVYLSEVAPARIRGRITGTYHLLVYCGMVILFCGWWANSKLEYSDTVEIQTIWAMPLIPTVLVLGMSLLLPESPRWLAFRGQWEKAAWSTVRPRNKRQNCSPDASEMPAIECAVATDGATAQHHGQGIWQMLRPRNLQRTTAGLLAHTWQRWAGMYPMTHYAVVALAAIGYPQEPRIVAVSVILCISIALTFLSLTVIDRVGRRPALIAGALIQMACLFVVGGVASGEPDRTATQYEFRQVDLLMTDAAVTEWRVYFAMSCIFVACFAATWGPGAVIYTSEIFPYRQRAVANGLAVGLSWGFDMLVVVFIPRFLDSATWRVFMMYGAFNAVMALHVFFLFPETRTLVLEEIDDLWAAKVPAWRSASYTPPRPASRRDLMYEPPIKHSVDTQATGPSHDF